MAQRKKQEDGDRLAGIARAAAGVAGAGLLAVAWHFGRDRVADALEAWADACEPEAYEQDEPGADSGDPAEEEGDRMREENERIRAEVAAMRERLKAYESREREGASGDDAKLREELEALKERARAAEADAAKSHEEIEGLRKENDGLRAKLAAKPKAKPKAKAKRKSRVELAWERGQKAMAEVAAGKTPGARYNAALGTTGSVGWRTADGWAYINPIPMPDGIHYEGHAYLADGRPVGAGLESYALEDVPGPDKRMTYDELMRLMKVAKERHERAYRERQERREAKGKAA